MRGARIWGLGRIGFGQREPYMMMEDYEEEFVVGGTYGGLTFLDLPNKPQKLGIEVEVEVEEEDITEAAEG